MKFPGSKLLHQWDLSVQSLSLEDLYRSCEQAGLTGVGLGWRNCISPYEDLKLKGR